MTSAPLHNNLEQLWLFYDYDTSTKQSLTTLTSTPASGLFGTCRVLAAVEPSRPKVLKVLFQYFLYFLFP